MSLLFKFVSSGQAVDDAVTISQVINGESIKPLAPVNAKGYRNANLDLVIEWVRRSRIAPGLRPLSGVPLAEERERYEVEVYSGTTLLRTWQVNADQNEPVIWTPISGLATYSEFANGGIENDTLLQAQARSLQPIYEDAFIEGTVGIGAATFPQQFTIESFNPGSIGTLYRWSANGTSARPEGVAPDISAAAGDRFAIELIGDSVQYYKNYAGPTSVPSYVSALSRASRPYFVNISLKVGADHGFRSCFLRRLGISSAFYSKEQQIADFGSTQPSVKVRIYQISAVLGRGPFVEATI